MKKRKSYLAIIAIVALVILLATGYTFSKCNNFLKFRKIMNKYKIFEQNKNVSYRSSKLMSSNDVIVLKRDIWSMHISLFYKKFKKFSKNTLQNKNIVIQFKTS